MIAMRKWGVEKTLLVLFLFVVLACERKGNSKEPESEQLVVPQENIRFDPALDDLGAPFAGLRVRTVGSSWGESERVVVLLHGYGAEGDDLVPLAERFHDQVPATYLLPEAPFSLATGGRAWFRRDRKNFEEGLSYVRALLAYSGRQMPASKLVLGGFSQGAMLTANLLATAPPELVGALIFSPAFHLTAPPTAESPRIPLLISHGTRDQILPFEQGVALKQRLESDGFPVKFVEFEGRHQIPPIVVREAARLLRDVM